MQTQRPPSQTRSRRRQETHTQGQRKQCVSAHRCRLKTAGRESRENTYTQKFSDTAIYIVYTGTVKGTVHRTRRHSHSQRHRQSQWYWNRQRNGTGALKGHSYTVTREQQKTAFTRKKTTQKGTGKCDGKMAQKRGWTHKIDTGRDADARSHKAQ